MKRTLLALALAAACLSAHAATFNYHGNLQDAGKPAQGSYDVELTLYSAPSGGSVIGGPLAIYAVPVRDGSFSTEADFGPLAKPFAQAYVGVRVRAAGKGDYAALGTRSVITPDVNTSCPGSWSLDGNSGNPAGSYIGTADSNDVVIKAGGVEVGHFSVNSSVSAATSYLPNGTKTFSVSGGGVGSAAAKFAFGGGANGDVQNSGSFVWGDNSSVTDPAFSHPISDTGANQFIAGAVGGVGINTANGPLGTEPLSGTELTIRSTGGDTHQTWINLLSQRSSTSKFRGFNLASDPTSGAVDYGAFLLRGLYNETGGLFYEPIMAANFFSSNSSSQGNSHIAFNRNDPQPGSAIIVGTNSSNGNGASLSIGGTWTNASSRTFKEGFAHVDAVSVLEKVVAMPVQTWLYKGDHDEGRHMGPVAEDFAQAFGLGNDEKHIGTVDESGVAFAAIQGLNSKLEGENAELHQQVDALAARLAALEHGKGK